MLVIVDVKPSSVTSIPTDAYFSVEEIREDGSTTEKTFVHAPSTMDAEEAEEIGVEHLLRDIKDAAVGSLATRVTSQIRSLEGLHLRMQEIAAYLQKVINGELPQNHIIMETLQDVFNLLPNLSSTAAAASSASDGAPPLTTATVTTTSNTTNPHVSSPDLEKSFTIKLNDQLMCVYLSSLIRAVIAMEDLIDPASVAV